MNFPVVIISILVNLQKAFIYLTEIASVKMFRYIAKQKYNIMSFDLE